jgi:hypothetical protein
VETFVFQHTRPEGAEEAPGTGIFSSAPKSPSPRRGEKGKKNPDPFSSSAFHGFRVGPPCGRAAPPAATIRRPVGAETAYAGRNAGRHSGAGRGILCTGGLRVLAHALAPSTIASSIFVGPWQCRVGALHPPSPNHDNIGGSRGPTLHVG